jgi:hypothetical protein
MDPLGGEVLMLAIRRFFATTMSSVNDRPRSHLVRRVIALAMGSALLTGTAALAADPVTVTTTTLATGAVFGGATQAIAVCYGFNSGTSSVLISSLVIRDQFAAVTGKKSCRVSPGAVCGLQVGIATTSPYSCTITSISPNAGDLRGVLDMRDISANVLINSNLH